MIEKQTCRVVKCLWIDNELKLCSEEFNHFCKENGILRHRIVKFTSHQNATAERLDRTIIERVRCLLFDIILSEEFSVELLPT